MEERNHYYNKRLKDFSRKLRNNSTLSEILLWNRLKNSQVKGYRFLRQRPIGKYIVDFYCKELKLAIEIDGVTHFDQMQRDARRDRDIMSYEVEILHFGDSQVKQNIQDVISDIESWIDNKIKYE